MSTEFDKQFPPRSSPLHGPGARHPVAAFLVMAYALAWSLLLAAVALGAPLRLASSLAAFLATAATGGTASVRDLARRCLRWRVGLRWYALALLGFPTGTLLGASAVRGPAPLEALVERWPLFFTMFLPEILVAVVLIQLWEEAAWTGSMQHRLQERHGPLRASILVAPAFAFAHLMWNLLEQPPAAVAFVAVRAILAIFIRVVVTTLYNVSGRSLLVAAVVHSSFNAATGSGGMRYTGELLTEPEATWVPLAVLAVVAVLVVLLTRGRLAYSPQRATPRSAEAVSVAAQSTAR